MSKRSDKEILKDLARLRDLVPEETTVEDLINKAKEREMAQVKNVKDKENRVQVGSWIDKPLWQRLKAQAALEGRGAGYVLDDAIRLYLETKQDAIKGNNV